MTCIVSAYMANVTTPQWLSKNHQKYTEFFIPLLQSNVPKIIFIDSTVIDDYKYYANQTTQIIPFIKETNYLYNHMHEITSIATNGNPEKDTVQYLLTQCHKTEWVKEAMEMSDFNQYIWVDFGIKHMCHCSNEEFTATIERLALYHYDNVRMATIWNPDFEYSNNIYKDMCWYFGGSVFGGKKQALLEFANLMKSTCLDIIYNTHTIMWEVNVWHLIYKQNKHLFTIYTCDHNLSILDNY